MDLGGPEAGESPAATPVTYEGDGGLRLTGDAYGDPSHSPVVLLHGGGQTRHAWGGTAAALAADGWYALSLDLRGHGHSAWDPAGDYSVDALVRDLGCVLRRLGRAPVLVGASLGGLTALAFAGESGEPIAALVLVDIAPRVEPDGVQRIIEFMTGNPDGFATLEEAADVVADYSAHRSRPRDVSGLRKNLRLGGDGRYRWHWDPRMMSGDKRQSATRNPERMERCARALRVPTLLVRGRMSDIVSEAGAQAFLAMVPHARYADVSGAGHMVAGDRNDAFSSAVLAFLRDADLR